MKSGTTKVLTLILSLFVFAMVGSQLYYRINEKHDTVDAELFSYNENITTQCVIVRNESVISYNGDGVLEYQYEDGSKVSVDSVLAKVYNSNDDILAQRKIESLNDRISQLQKAQEPGTTDYVQPETLKSQIDEQYKTLISATLENDFESMRKAEQKMMLTMSIYNIVTKTTASYDEIISSLTSQVNSLSSTAGTSTSEIKAEESGYFVSFADGYESTLSADKVNSLTAEKIKSIIDGSDGVAKPSNAVGKMLSDYSCKIVAIMPADSRVSEGKTLQAMFNSSNNIYDVTVDTVTPIEDSDDTIVVLSCNILDSTLLGERVQRIELVFDEYTGLKVPRSALRFNADGEKGVYVILGQEITFKKIDIVYESEDGYVLSKNTSDKDYLLLYDQILLEVVSDDEITSSTESS